ncbi:MAG: hypothetical protein KC468_19610, partial [Myxococcales bacterium]|nr:hypothetical protein [Myxococcales bacterium]
MYRQRTRSLTSLVLGGCLGLCAAAACATADADHNHGEPHEPIPVVDPTPEFEHDNVEDHSHSRTDLQTTIARLNPEFAAMLRDTGVAADF